MSGRIRYKGKRYGHLEMLRPSRTGGQGIGSYWIAKCDCGTEKEVLARAVSGGRILTCGNCIHHENLRRGGRDMSTRQRREYAKALASATDAGVKWAITPIEFQNYIQGNCSVCDTPPYETKMKLERMDSRAPYTLSNCVVTCSTCRRMRGSGSLQGLLDHIQKIIRKLSNNS